MNKYLTSMAAIAAFLLGITTSGFSLDTEDKHHEMPAYEGSAPFKTIKKWVGKWEGTSKMGDKEHPAVAEYSITANGSAVVEKISPGTPMEMVSVYHDDNGAKLTMTHYCALGNQPRMTLKKATDNTIEMKLAKGQKKLAKTPHMHELKVVMDGEDKMTQHWTMYENGKKKMTSVAQLTRVKE